MFFRTKFIRFQELFPEFGLVVNRLVEEELCYFVKSKKTWLPVCLFFNVSFLLFFPLLFTYLQLHFTHWVFFSFT